MKITFDYYTLHARLFPIFILLLPLGLIFTSWFPTTSVWIGILETLSVPAILTALFSQLGRDLGKKKEAALFTEWGGMPTDRILAFSATILDRSTLNRYRAKLTTLLPDIQFLDEAQEVSFPDTAIQVFRTCTNFLREKTRDRERFALIFSENVNYGFRRNLWAMKPAGIVISAIGVLSCALSLFINPNSISNPILILATVFSVCLFVFWIFRINKNWVRMPAEEYARQLFASCENL